MSDFSNKLTPAQIERLAILSEEMGEAQHIIGKILRHGYESYDPTQIGPTNRLLLEAELGDLLYTIDTLMEPDIPFDGIWGRANRRPKKLDKYLHHQAAPQRNRNRG